MRRNIGTLTVRWHSIFQRLSLLCIPCFLPRLDTLVKPSTTTVTLLSHINNHCVLLTTRYFAFKDASVVHPRANRMIWHRSSLTFVAPISRIQTEGRLHGVGPMQASAQQSHLFTGQKVCLHPQLRSAPIQWRYTALPGQLRAQWVDDSSASGGPNTIHIWNCLA